MGDPQLTGERRIPTMGISIFGPVYITEQQEMHNLLLQGSAQSEL